ncbi:MAG: hypothetical protein KDJ36_17715, partial [Hyphomicrobiaceae bacterium]|nr:hypothetical protein [Hyphomicrobiaceae bacterium]
MLHKWLLLDDYYNFGIINNVIQVPSNVVQFTTNKNGTFAPTVTKTGAVAHWDIGGQEFDTNSPSVALTGEDVLVTVTFDDETTVTRFLATNQGIQGWPKNLNKLVNLERLYLTGATLNSSIPSWIFNLSSLQQLWLDNTGLTGLIPANFENLTSLQLLYLNSNNLSGIIPWEFLPTSLTQLYLNTNNFYGAIRSELALLTSLQKLRLDFNDLTTYENGSLSIPTLTEIRLQNNNLAQVVCNGIIREIANYGSRAASGSLNLDNNNRPEQDIIDNEVTTLTGASWTVTYETVEDVQRYVSFETGDLTEAEYDHGDVMFLSQVGASSASYQVIDTDAYQGTYSLEMSISDTEVDQAGSRYIQRWYDNLGSGEKIKDGDFLSLAMKLPAEPVLDSGLSDEFVQVTQIKYQHTDGSDAMFSMNVGRPSQSPNPSILQFYLNIKRPNGLKQVQVYQNSPVELPINQWFIVQYRIKQSTINGNYVNPDGVMEIWSGLPDSISKIFELTNIYTISDVDPTGRLQFGAGNAYGKGILSPNPFKVLIDEIRISKLYKHLVSDPGAIPSLNPNLFQIITQKQGTFSPTV